MRALLSLLHSDRETVKAIVQPPHRTPADRLYDSVTKAIEAMGPAIKVPPSPPPLPRAAQPYHPMTRRPTFRQAGYNR